MAATFWFEGVDPSRDPATAVWLRRSLQETIDPNLLDRPGLTPEECAAYAVNYYRKEEVRRQQEVERSERRLREALRHAGAELIDYLERRDSYRVTYTIGGRQHVSAVRKDHLSVQVAGICLSGQDRHFDLASLVGVIREAEGGGEFVPVGYDKQRHRGGCLLARASTWRRGSRIEDGRSRIGHRALALSMFYLQSPILGLIRNERAHALYRQLGPGLRAVLGARWTRQGRVWHARRIGRCSGNPAEVEFDGPAVLAREERRRDLVGFLHTHPSSAAVPSRRDLATMRAWVSAFGKPLLCLIEERTNWRGIGLMMTSRRANGCCWSRPFCGES